jgi:hypothetical protein
MSYFTYFFLTQKVIIHKPKKSFGIMDQIFDCYINRHYKIQNFFNVVSYSVHVTEICSTEKTIRDVRIILIRGTFESCHSRSISASDNRIIRCSHSFCYYSLVRAYYRKLLLISASIRFHYKAYFLQVYDNFFTACHTSH